MITLSTRDRRALRLGAWIALPVLAYTLLLRPMLDTIRLQRDQLTAERALLQAERDAAHRASTGRVAGVGGAPGVLAADRLFEGRDDMVASAAFAAWLAEVTRGHELALEQLETRTVTREIAGLRTLHVDLVAEGDVEGVVRFLATLATERQLVRVETLALQPAPGGERAGGTEPLVLQAALAAFAADTAATTWLAQAGAADALGARGRTARVAMPHVRTATETNVLSPARTAPLTRYVLVRAEDTNGEDVAGFDAPMQPVVLGTAVGAGGDSFAMVRLGASGDASVLRVGDALAGWTVLSIARGQVVFRDAAGARLTLDAPSSSDGVMP